MKEITLDTKITDLLNDYAGMKDILIRINPKFKKLNNPVLRRTLAKVAGVRQAAVVGGMDPADLLNQLREAVGQEPLEMEMPNEATSTKEKPKWASREPKVTLDANQLLDEERNPLAELHKALKLAEDSDVIVIVADFRPEPLIDEMYKAGHEVFVQEAPGDKYLSYIKK